MARVLRALLANALFGFVVGGLAVLTFHQATLGLLHGFGLVANPPFRMAGTGPLGIPAVFNAAFWGGIWGIAIVPLAERLRGGRARVMAALLLGAIGATAVAWFVVAPLKGLPMAAGWDPAAMWRGPLINGAFGLGIGLIAPGLGALLGRTR